MLAHLDLGQRHLLLQHTEFFLDIQGKLCLGDCTRETETLSEAKIQILRVGQPRLIAKVLTPKAVTQMFATSTSHFSERVSVINISHSLCPIPPTG